MVSRLTLLCLVLCCLLVNCSAFGKRWGKGWGPRNTFLKPKPRLGVSTSHRYPTSRSRLSGNHSPPKLRGHSRPISKRRVVNTKNFLHPRVHNSGHVHHHHHIVMPKNYHSKPQYLYVTEYKKSNSPYRNLLTGLALYNLGRSHNHYHHYYNDNFYRRRYHHKHTAEKPKDEAYCVLKIKDHQRVDTLEIPCEIVSTFTDGSSKQIPTKQTEIIHTNCTTKIFTKVLNNASVDTTRVDNNTTVGNSTVTANTTSDINSTAATSNTTSVNSTSTDSTSAINSTAATSNTTSVNSTSTDSTSAINSTAATSNTTSVNTTSADSTGAINSTAATSNTTSVNFTSTDSYTTSTTTIGNKMTTITVTVKDNVKTVNLTICFVNSTATDPLAVKGESIKADDMECVVEIHSKHTLFSHAVDCKTLQEYSVASLDNNSNGKGNANKKGSIISVCWVSGAVVGLLPLFGWHNGESESWTRGCYFVEVMDYNYLLFLYFATIVTPSVLLAAFYAHIYRVVVKQLSEVMTVDGSRGRLTGGGTMLRVLGAAQKREVKATQNLAIIVFFFIICWIPLYTVNAIKAFMPELDIPNPLTYFCIIFSHLNSAINPILYAYHLKDFRAALKGLLCTIIGRGVTLEEAYRPPMPVRRPALERCNALRERPKVYINSPVWLRQRAAEISVTEENTAAALTTPVLPDMEPFLDRVADGSSGCQTPEGRDSEAGPYLIENEHERCQSPYKKVEAFIRRVRSVSVSAEHS